jgi:hypothetical protein
MATAGLKLAKFSPPSPAGRGTDSLAKKEPGPRVILENLRIPDVAAQGIDGSVPGSRPSP